MRSRIRWSTDAPAAEYLIVRGADLNWVPDYAKGTQLDAGGGLGTRRETLICWLRDQGAHASEPRE